MGSPIETEGVRRACERCGRSGFKAFEPVPGDRAAWRCTHIGPCDARRRSLIRVGARQALGRPKSSPLMALVGEDEPICLIASDRVQGEELATWLRNHTPLEVDVLDYSYRSMTRLSRTQYSLCVLDARASDPLAGCNELVRRLSATTRARQPLVVLAGSERDLRGPVRDLVRRPNARLVQRRDAPESVRAAIESLIGSAHANAAALSA